jgi:hypothetical protein
LTAASASELSFGLVFEVEPTIWLQIPDGRSTVEILVEQRKRLRPLISDECKAEVIEPRALRQGRRHPHQGPQDLRAPRITEKLAEQDTRASKKTGREVPQN